MGKSITQKILESHLVKGRIIPGEEIFIKVDQTLTHDINAVMTYLAFEAIGLDRVRTECSVSYLDHNLLYRQQFRFSLPRPHCIGAARELRACCLCTPGAVVILPLHHS